MEQNSSRFATIDPSRQIDPASAFAGLPQFAKPPSLISDMQSAITTHHDWVAARKAMLATTEKSIRENILSVISPILLALALALRITKVTGEILLERAAKAATASKEDRTAGAVQTEDQAAVLPIEPGEVPGSSSSPVTATAAIDKEACNGPS
jgi:hypothetical protein